MGLLDKMKDTAAQATAAAKDAAQKGQTKLDTMQVKKAADAMFRDLGVAVYAAHTDRATPDLDAGADRLVAALQQHEAEHGAIDLSFESPAAGVTAGVPSAADPATPAPAPPPTAADPASPPPPLSGTTI